MSEIRSTEPKEIKDIMAETMAIIRERANINYETATPYRETAIAKPAPHIDFEVGDLVQIRGSGKYHVGRVGVIIGSRYAELDKGGACILYTIKFTDSEASDYVANNLSFIKAGNSED